MVKWATDQGHTTFIMSWVNPDEKLAAKSFEDYLLEGSMAAIESGLSRPDRREQRQYRRLLPGRHAAHGDAGLHGCQEGQARRFRHLLHDHARFLRAGRTAGLPRRGAPSPASRRRWSSAATSTAREMAGTFNMLRANDLIWSFVVNNYLMGKDPFPFDLLYWNSDSTRMPAAMHSFYLRNMYLEQQSASSPAASHWAASRSTCARSRPRATSSRRSKITSRRGRAPTWVPACRAAPPSSSSAAPATSPASSTRRWPTSTATGPMTRLTATCRKTLRTSSPARRRIPAPGGRTGTNG